MATQASLGLARIVAAGGSKRIAVVGSSAAVAVTVVGASRSVGVGNQGLDLGLGLSSETAHVVTLELGECPVH